MKKILVFSLLIMLGSCGKSTEEKQRIIEIDSLKTEIRELQRAMDTLSDQLMKKNYVTKDFSSYFDSIPEPEKFLIEKLKEKSELIPKKAVLGGTMHFIEVSFINDNLILAEYEDGHIMGRAIYQYKMDKNGKLKFELLSELKD
ncbi:MAG: hypothetical protein JJE07_07625 [Flavobacteriaceae bacterium]|nr:hypothetical protein [Flavobacteriaceae bacterium]